MKESNRIRAQDSYDTSGLYSSPDNGAVIDEGLLSVYGTPVPRYTSYPPATKFGPPTQAERTSLVQKMRDLAPTRSLSIYLHLPFCRSMCLYCGCAVTISKSGDKWGPYISLLKQEIQQAAKIIGPRRVTQIHWGGGSPSWLPPKDASELMSCLRNHFPVTPEAEISIEVDPETVREGQLERYREIGFNRLSMGVQDLNKKVQIAVGRVFPKDLLHAVFQDARELGFGSVNLDLIYGLPYQSPATFEKTVLEVASWVPDRLAVFGYAHVPWIRPHQKLLPANALPKAPERVESFARACSILGSRGYEHIGLDHFVRPCDSLATARRHGRLTRNFQGYTIDMAQDMIGFGVTAIGDICGAYVANHRSLSIYEGAVRSGKVPFERILTRSARQNKIRDAITSVMCQDITELGQFLEDGAHIEQVFGDQAQRRLTRLEQDGIIELDGTKITVTQTGRFFLRHIAAALDPDFSYSDQSTPNYSMAL